MNHASISLSMMGIDSATIEILNSHAVFSLEDLELLSFGQLYTMPGIGQARLSRILDKMQHFGVKPRVPLSKNKSEETLGDRIFAINSLLSPKNQ